MVFRPRGDEAESWVGELTLKGNVNDVAAGIRRSATLRQLSPEERKVVHTCADYLLKCRDMLRSDEYLPQGIPIATGIIEGPCRHLIKGRMDKRARWRLRSAEAVLKLRSLHSSGHSGAYW